MQAQHLLLFLIQFESFDTVLIEFLLYENDIHYNKDFHFVKNLVILNKIQSLIIVTN